MNHDELYKALCKVPSGKEKSRDRIIIELYMRSQDVYKRQGLSLGKDLGAFRRLSWRIIPVALAVTAGTFICATALAQLVLHLEGLI